MEKYLKPETDRRKYKRLNTLHLSTPVEIFVPENKTFSLGIILDISPVGIGILSFHPLEINKTVCLKLNIKNIETGIILAHVVWIKKLHKIYRIGLQFINISAKDFFQIYKFVENHSLEDW